MDHGSEGEVDHDEALTRDPGEEGSTETGGGLWTELLEDATVRAVLDDNHRPVEELISGGFRVWPGRVRCAMCQQPWPCDVRKALMLWDARAREKVLAKYRETMGRLEWKQYKANNRPFWRRLLDALAR